MASRDPTARLSRPDPTRHGEKTLGADRCPQKCLEAAWEGNVWVQAMGETHQSRASWDTGSYPITGSSVGVMGLWGHHPSWHPLPCSPATWHSPGCLINPKIDSVHPQAPLLPPPSPYHPPLPGGTGKHPQMPPTPQNFPPSTRPPLASSSAPAYQRGAPGPDQTAAPTKGTVGRLGTQTTQQKLLVFCRVLKSSPGCPRAAPGSLPSSLPSWVRGLPCSALFTKPWIFPSSCFCILAEPPWPSK